MPRLTSIESVPVERIHQEAVIVDGRKYFGRFDDLVETGTRTSVSEFNPGQPDVSIVISAMERDERLRETVTRIISTVGNLKRPSRVVIMDNSITSHLENEIIAWVKPLVNESVESVVYHHDPRMTQTTGRNIAFNRFVGDSESVLLWDGDIYSHPRALEAIQKNWVFHPSLAAMAPVMAGYLIGEIDYTLSKFSDIADNPKTIEVTHMPGRIGAKIGSRDGNLIALSMMRGCFWVKRSAIEAVAAINPDGEPWLKDFVSMNNVPFFLAFKELGFDLAYLLDRNAVVLHDDRVDELSVGFKLPMREAQTLMELTAIMYRNKVYTPEGKMLNSRFLNFNLAEISRVTNSETKNAGIFQEYLLKIASLLGISKDKEEFMLNYKSIRPTSNDVLGNVCDKVVSAICTGNTFSRIKSLKSYNPQRMIYST